MRRVSYVYIVIGSFALGIFLNSFFHISLFVIGICFVVSGVVFSLNFFWSKKFFILFSIFIVVFCLGTLRVDIFEARHIADRTLADKKINVEGKAVSIPEIQNGRIIFNVSSDDIKGNIRVITQGVNLKRGDRVNLEGTITLPKNFETDNGREFDYVRYLKKDNVLYEMRYAKVEVRNGIFWHPQNILSALHASFLQKINQSISYPESSILAGILLGAKNDIPKEVEDNMRDVGLIHILVLSGYNISLVTKFVQIWTRYFGRRTRIAIDLTFIFLFVCFVGATATVVRAACMAAIAILGEAFYQTSHVFHALLIAGFFMILHNPYILAFDPSFELSFLATTGLILLSPFFETLFTRIPNFYKIKETLATTVSTQIFVLPLVVYFSGIISPISILANIIVLPLIPIAMIVGFISGLLSYVWAILAMPFSFVTSLLLSFIIFSVEIFSKIPFSFFTVKSVSGKLMILVYILLFGTILWIYRKKKYEEI